jgi:hypothetical protein
MNTEQRISQLGPLTPIDQPRPKPVDPDINRPLVTYLPEPTRFVRPTAGELREIYDTVLTKHPSLGPYRSITNPIGSVTETEHYQGFCSAFERLGHIGRAAQPDTKHYVSHWAAEAADWLKRHRPGHHGNIGSGFLCAVLAHGDIAYVVGDGARGVVWSVGLTQYGGTTASDKWRDVLDGKLMAPMPARRYA